MLHRTRVTYVNFASSQVAVYEEVTKEVMLHMIYVQLPNHIRTVMFFDDGSSCSIIAHKLAVFMGIKGKKIMQWMEVAGCDFERYETLLYKMELTTFTKSMCWGWRKLQVILAA